MHLVEHERRVEVEPPPDGRLRVPEVGADPQRDPDLPAWATRVGPLCTLQVPLRELRLRGVWTDRLHRRRELPELGDVQAG